MSKLNEGLFSRWPKSMRKVFCDVTCEDKLDNLLKETITEWYEAKHRIFSNAEIELVNSLTPTGCPKCGGIYCKCGKRKDGTQTYQCKVCKTRFNALTGSIFDSRKIPLSEWIEFLIHLIQFHTLSSASYDNENARSTGKYWLKKTFEIIKDYQKDIVLSGNVYIDETYIRDISSSLNKKDNKLLRGLSKNEFCIITAAINKECVFIVAGKDKPSSIRVVDALSSHIKDNSHIIDDGEKAHIELIKKNNLTREIHYSKDTKGLSDDKNPMVTINTVHSYFKKFMSSHNGFNRDELQDWCNLFVFIYNRHGDTRKVVKDLIKMGLNCKKVIRYRTEKEKNTSK